MTYGNRQRNGSRVALVSRGACAAQVALTLLVAASVCHAGDFDSGEKRSNGQRVALNQGVVLAEGVPGSPAVSAGPAEVVPGEPRESTGGINRSRNAASSAGAAHAVRRARLSRAVNAMPRAHTGAWYRTGFGALAIVLAVIVAAAWAVRRWLPVARAGDTGLLRVVARASLSQKHNVALIHLGRRFVMIGISGDRLATLCEITDPNEVAQLVAGTADARTRGGTGFDDLLSRERAHFDQMQEQGAAARQPVQAGTGPTVKPLKDLLRRLRALQSTQTT